MQKVIEDADFNSGAWVSATNYVNAFGGNVTGCLGDIDNFLKKVKLEQVVAIVKSCSPNALGDLNVTLKDGIVRTEMELVLEHTQKGSSNETSWVSNSLVHSLRTLSTLRCSDLRTASTAAKPCQGDSSEFYLITGRIPTVTDAGKRHIDS
ncbi:hypothetical protein Tco_1461151 [Tanacetum coccineum]